MEFLLVDVSGMAIQQRLVVCHSLDFRVAELVRVRETVQRLNLQKSYDFCYTNL
jgi:hypothetical protein